MASIKSIIYLTGTRADYGLMRKILFAIDQHPAYKLTLLVCGMHLMESHGNSIQEIRQDGFDLEVMNIVPKGDSRINIAEFIGNVIIGVTNYLENNICDTMLLLGDRGEMLAAAIAGAYSGKLLIHIHGGDRSSTIDDAARHAISKLSHIHFAAIEESAERLIRMGEQPSSVYTIGSPGLEGIKDDLLDRNTVCARLKVPSDKDIILVVFHPVTEEIGDAGMQMEILLESISSSDRICIIVTPNSDAGNARIREVIASYTNQQSNFYNFHNLTRKVFLSLMQEARFMIGNSSAGIIESASFSLPVINVGNRQLGRLSPLNVIHVNCDREEIQNAIHKIDNDPFFQRSQTRVVNPYGDGKTSSKVIDILGRINISSHLLQKSIRY